MIGLKAVSCNTGDVLVTSAGASGEQGGGAQSPGQSFRQFAKQTGRIAQLGGEVRNATRGRDYTIVGGAESLQPGAQDEVAKGDTAGLPFYKRAVELDPNFAMPYDSISSSYGNLNEPARRQRMRGGLSTCGRK